MPSTIEKSFHNMRIKYSKQRVARSPKPARKPGPRPNPNGFRAGSENDYGYRALPARASKKSRYAIGFRAFKFHVWAREKPEPVEMITNLFWGDFICFSVCSVVAACYAFHVCRVCCAAKESRNKTTVPLSSISLLFSVGTGHRSCIRLKRNMTEL